MTILVVGEHLVYVIDVDKGGIKHVLYVSIRKSRILIMYFVWPVVERFSPLAYSL